VKVLTRQYWVGLAGSGSTSFRGSSVTKDLVTGSTEPTNFGALSTPIFPQPLTKETWKEVGEAIASAQSPRTSDFIFCNAMLVLRDGSFQEAMALLGIACEVELSDCLESLLSTRKDAITDILYERARPDFKWKLNKLLPSLSGEDFSKDEPHWHSQLMHLYERRGKAAHGGLTPDMVRDLPRFVLATDSFLRWIHSIRSAIGESVGPRPLSIQATSGI
jgi:hypothetical protein